MQINAEMWSSNLYLSMAFYLKNKGLDGCANWLMKQSQEELNHAYEIADYLSKRGEKAEVGMVDVVPTGWGDVAEVSLKTSMTTSATCQNSSTSS